MSDMDVCFCGFFDQHPRSHRGRCVPGGDCRQPAPLQTPPDEDQSFASLGRGSLPHRHVSLRIHHWGLHRGPCEQEPDHLHLEPQPHNSDGEVSDSLWFVAFRRKKMSFFCCKFPMSLCKKSKSVYDFISQILSSSQLFRALSAGCKCTVLVHSHHSDSVIFQAQQADVFN